MRIVCISDTHSRHADLVIPDGDVLVHAGDLSKRGQRHEIEAFDAWLGTLPHRHKLVIAGNHDFAFERGHEARAWIRHAIYLEDEAVTLDGLRFYGSPWQPRFYDWAFNLDRGASIRAVWDRIPPDTDVLITHGPPHGVLDRTARGDHVGCEELLVAVERLQPRLHVFGHIHEAHGSLRRGPTTYVNACSLDLRYEPVHAPIVVELDASA